MSNENQSSKEGKGGFKFIRSDYKELIISLFVALIVALIGAVIYQGKKMAALEERINSTKEVVAGSKDNPIRENKNELLENIVEEISNPDEKLIELIKSYQTRYVKKSTGTYDYQAFTDNDLIKFYDRKVTDKLERKLSEDGEFLGLVLAIKEITPQEWGKLKNEALLVFKPTFGEAGGVKADGSAQTEAGQEAEREIAETIVDLVTKLKRKDKAQLIEMID